MLQYTYVVHSYVRTSALSSRAPTGRATNKNNLKQIKKPWRARFFLYECNAIAVAMPPKPHRSDKKKQRDEDRRRNREETGTWAPASPQQLQSEATAAALAQASNQVANAAQAMTSMMAMQCMMMNMQMQQGGTMMPGMVVPGMMMPGMPSQAAEAPSTQAQAAPSPPSHPALREEAKAASAAPPPFASKAVSAIPKAFKAASVAPAPATAKAASATPEGSKAPSVATAPPAATAKAPSMAAAPPTRPKESSSAAAPPSRSKASSSAAAPADDSDGSEDSEDEAVQPAKKQKVIQSKAMSSSANQWRSWNRGWSWAGDPIWQRPRRSCRGRSPSPTAKTERSVILTAKNANEWASRSWPWTPTFIGLWRSGRLSSAMCRASSRTAASASSWCAMGAATGQQPWLAPCWCWAMDSLWKRRKSIFFNEPWETRWFVEWCEQNKG